MIMGFDTFAQSKAELWLQYADHFPVRKNLVYLNHAAVSPLCRPAAEAMQGLNVGCRYGLAWFGRC